jgi:2-iminobutanoate/2-iminopropanoate deaminase
MCPVVQTITPPGTPVPIGPYSHVARAGSFITISATAAIDPVTGGLAGADMGAQVKRIVESFKVMLAAAESDLEHILHVTVFLKDMQDFAAMNLAYSEAMGTHQPARTVVAVTDLPKPVALLTMNLIAVTRD